MEHIFPEWADAQKVIEAVKGIENVRVQSYTQDNTITPAHVQAAYSMLGAAEDFIIVQHRRVRDIERSIREQDDSDKQAYVAFEGLVQALRLRIDHLSPVVNLQVAAATGSVTRWFDVEYLAATKHIKLAMQLLKQKIDLEQYLASNLCKAMKSLVERGNLNELEVVHWNRSINLIAFGEERKVITQRLEGPETAGASTQTSNQAMSRAEDVQPTNVQSRLVPQNGNHALQAADTNRLSVTQQQEQTPSTSPEKNHQPAKQEPCSLCGWLNHSAQNCWKVRTGQIVLDSKRKNDTSPSTSLDINTNTNNNTKLTHLHPTTTQTCRYCDKPGHTASTCHRQYPHLRPLHPRTLETRPNNSNWAKPIGKRNAHVDYFVDVRTQSEKDRARRKAEWSEKWIGDARGPYESDDGSRNGKLRC